MKTKLLTLTMTAILATYPYLETKAQTTPARQLPVNWQAPQSPFDPSGPKPDCTLLEACLAFAIIGTLTLIYVGTCIYNHVGNATNTPPQWTNEPPIIGPPMPTGTNDPPIWTNPPIAVLTSSGPIDLVRISSMGFADTNGPAGCIFTEACAVTLVAGPSPNALAPLYRVRAWTSAVGRLVEWSDTDGVPLQTVYARWGQTPRVPIPIGTGLEPARFFALLP